MGPLCRHVVRRRTAAEHSEPVRVALRIEQLAEQFGAVSGIVGPAHTEHHEAVEATGEFRLQRYGDGHAEAPGLGEVGEPTHPLVEQSVGLLGGGGGE